MLFFCFIAALSGATGWMGFWAIFGMIFSDRPAFLFILPLLAAVLGMPEVGVVIIALTWFGLFMDSANKAADRHERRMADEALIAQATANAALSGIQRTPRTMS